MPNVTPVWNLPYPCPGDVVGAADFLALDVAIDSALSVLDAQQTARRNRPHIRWYRDVATNVATGASLAINPTATDFSENWPVFNTVPVSGLYHIGAVCSSGDNSAASIVSETLLVNFFTYTGELRVVKYNESLVDVGLWTSVSGYVPLQAGETIIFTYTPTGTAGTVTITFAGLWARLVVPL